MFVGEKVTYGSKRYCSIDQLKMAPVNIQFDIYSLGIIMYELITKEKPFMDMDSKSILKAKLENNLSIKNIILDIPDFADEIFYKSLGVTNENYHNITEMKNDLIKIANCVK